MQNKTEKDPPPPPPRSHWIQNWIYAMLMLDERTPAVWWVNLYLHLQAHHDPPLHRPSGRWLAGMGFGMFRCAVCPSSGFLMFMAPPLSIHLFHSVFGGQSASVSRGDANDLRHKKKHVSNQSLWQIWQQLQPPDSFGLKPRALFSRIWGHSSFPADPLKLIPFHLGFLQLWPVCHPSC